MKMAFLRCPKEFEVFNANLEKRSVADALPLCDSFKKTVSIFSSPRDNERGLVICRVLRPSSEMFEAKKSDQNLILVGQDIVQRGKARYSRPATHVRKLHTCGSIIHQPIGPAVCRPGNGEISFRPGYKTHANGKENCIACKLFNRISDGEEERNKRGKMI